MERLIILLPLIPLLSALANHLWSHKLGRQVARVSVNSSILTFGIAVLLLVLMLKYDLSGQVSLGGNWGILLLDPLSILMVVLISGISMIVRIYSVRYMMEEEGYSRFFVLLDLMAATLFFMVTSGDLITLLISWHLVGVLLYFLIRPRYQQSFRFSLCFLDTFNLSYWRYCNDCRSRLAV